LRRRPPYPASIGEYRLDNFGWWQFEHLCQTLLQAELGLGVQVWGGHSDLGRDAYVEQDLAFPIRGVSQAGPFVFQAKFVADSAEIGRRAETHLRRAVRGEIAAIKLRKAQLHWGRVGCYVLMSNARIRPGFRVEIETLLGAELPGSTVVVMGEGEISAFLTSAPYIRSSFPQLLSLRDLSALVEEALNRGLSTRTHLMLAHARELAPVFVPTDAYGRATSILRSQGFVVLTGPPELGKTTIAETVALALSTEGWQVFACDTPADFFDGYRKDRARPQLFVADDAFGTTEYDPDRSESWAREMHRILVALRQAASYRAALIWTSRPEPLYAALSRLREVSGQDDFPEPNRILVDARSLDVREKALMLYRHSKAAELSQEQKAVVRRVANRIVSSPHFTPDRIRRFATTGLKGVLENNPKGADDAIDAAALAELSQATSRMQNAYNALREEHRALLFSLLESDRDLSGASAEDHLREAFSRHAPEFAADADALAERLSDQFIRIQSRGALGEPGRHYSWLHPTWRDLVIENLSADGDARQRFIHRSRFRGFSLAVSTRGGAAGARRLPLLQTSGDWEAWRGLAVRLGEDTDVSPWSVLTRLDEAYQASVDPDERRELDVTTGAVLDTLRQRWAQERIPNDDVAIYWRLSERLDPIPPSPPLGPTWAALTTPWQGSHEGAPWLSEAVLRAAADLFEFVRLVETNEPRFLRQRLFPNCLSNGLSAFAAQIREAVDEAEGREPQGESDEVDRLQALYEVLEDTPPYLPLEPGEVDDLLQRLEMPMEEEREAYERSTYEPDDDDAPRGGSWQRFNVDALFEDL
jgi:hypothetical protein